MREQLTTKGLLFYEKEKTYNDYMKYILLLSLFLLTSCVFKTTNNTSEKQNGRIEGKTYSFDTYLESRLGVFNFHDYYFIEERKTFVLETFIDATLEYEISRVQFHQAHFKQSDKNPVYLSFDYQYFEIINTLEENKTTFFGVYYLPFTYSFDNIQEILPANLELDITDLTHIWEFAILEGEISFKARTF